VYKKKNQHEEIMKLWRASLIPSPFLLSVFLMMADAGKRSMWVEGSPGEGSQILWEKKVQFPSFVTNSCKIWT